MKLNKYIDHTLLKQDAKKKQIDSLLSEAREYDFASVCVNPTWVEHAKKGLEGTDVKVCTVVGFPLGATTSAVKAFETKEAIQNGADEIDMVINVGALKSGNLALVESDIRAVVEASGDKLVKVIIEACLLTDQEKIVVCQLAQKAGADFVKTSTGFSTGGATIADVTLMRETVGSDMGVKAAGGARSYVPYSHFPIGAVLVAKDGNVYTGVNIENASYPLTNCGERTAIFKAISEGQREFSELIVYGQTEKPISPCGACRQVMVEFFEQDLKVTLVAKDKSTVEMTVGELLPYSFTDLN